MVSFKDCKPVLGMVGLQVIYATVILWTKACLDHGMSSRVFVVYRHVVATIALAPSAYFASRSSRKQENLGKKLGWVFLTAFFGVTLNQNFYLLGLHLGSSSMASALSNSIPAITFLMAACVGMEKVNLRSLRSLAKVVGTASCVGGAASMALFKGNKLLSVKYLTSGFLFQSLGENWMVACLFLMGSNCCWSIWLILQVPLCVAFPDPFVLSFWMCLFVSLQAGAITLIFERDPAVWIFTRTEALAVLYAGVFGSGVAYYIQSWCIKRRGPLFSAMFNPLCTVATTILAFFLLHEELYVGSLIGASAVVVGLYVVLWGKAEDLNTSSDPGRICAGKAAAVAADECCTADLEQPLLADKSQAETIA